MRDSEKTEAVEKVGAIVKAKERGERLTSEDGQSRDQRTVK